MKPHSSSWSDESLKEISKEIYPIYSAQLSEDDLREKISTLDEEERGRFLRASNALQQSSKCEKCDQNISMLLLCIAVEAMNPRSQLLFKDYLIRACLQKLEMKSSNNLKKTLNRLYNEFVKVPEREGVSHNFIRFLEDYCPSSLQDSPIIIMRLSDKPITRRPASFSESLSFIYSEFRSLYLHEGLGRLLSSEELEELHSRFGVLGGSYQWTRKSDEEYYNIHNEAVLEWFSKVVKCTLINWLTAISGPRLIT